MRRRLRHPLVWGSISLVLLALVAWRSRAWELGDRLGEADVRPIILALLLNAVIVVAWAARSSDLLAGVGCRVGPLSLIPMTAFANIVNNVTPGSVGELARLYLLREHHGVDYASGAAVVVVERIVAIGLIGASALILWASFLLGLPPVVTALAIVGLLLAPSLAYRSGLRPAIVLTWLPLGRVIGEDRWAIVGRTLGRIDATVASLLTDLPRALVFGLWTTVVFVTYTGQLLLVAAAIGRPLEPAAAWGALGLGIIAGVVSLLPFGLGSTDLVVAGLLGVAGVPAAEAVAIMFGYRVVSTVPLGLIGVGSYAWLSARLPHGHASDAATAASAALRGLEATRDETARPR